MNRNIYVPRTNSIRGILFLIAMIAAFSVGLVLSSTAHGAPLRQDAKGDITGVVTVNGQGIAGMSVELRQRNNGGQDTTLAGVKTDGSGTYHFTSQPSAPNDAFYYIRFVSGKGTLASWYSFPIIYLMGTQVTVPGVDIGDVALSAPAQNANIVLPYTFTWTARRMGETYRLFVYAAGHLDKPVLDSGSLGTRTDFLVSDSVLQPGKYEGVVQVRDAVAGYGQSQAHFVFTVGAAAAQVQPAPQSQPANGIVTVPGTASQGQATPADASPASPTVEIAPTAPAATAVAEAPAAGDAATPNPESNNPKPDINVNLSADKTSVSAGESITYKIDVQNAGKGTASGVVVTDQLPEGVNVDVASVKTGAGTVVVEGGKVTVTLGEVVPGQKTTVEIPVKVTGAAAANVSNQASATYAGAADAVQSNAYVAEVAAPVSGAQPAQQPASTGPAAPQNSAQPPAQAPAAQAPAAPAAQPPAQAPAQAPQSSAAQPPASSQSSAPASGANSSAGSPPKSSVQAPKPNAGTQAQVAAPPKKAAAVPQTGGSFPVLLAVALVVFALLARYLRGFAYRRV